MSNRIAAYIDPWGEALYGDRLFDPSSPLNRDDVTRPWRVLKEAFEARGIPCHTVDFLLRGQYMWEQNLYISIGQRQYWPLLKSRPGVRLFAYFQLEPPVVDPQGYEQLPTLLRNFENVFTHDPAIFGGQKLLWPQVKDGLLPGTQGPRARRLCMINANKQPHPDSAARQIVGDLGGWPTSGSLYSMRLETFDALGSFGIEGDLYGAGWEGHPRWHGVTPDKFETLRQYDFALVFENEAMRGYVTEKAFEAMVAGCVPIYLGCPDVMDFVDQDCFIHVRDSQNPLDLAQRINRADLLAHRQAIAEYLKSERFKQFTAKAFADRLISKV